MAETSPLAAVTVLALEDFSNADLAAANNGVSGWGVVQKQNRAYGPLLAASLINADGKPRDLESLQQALSFEVNRRVQAGTFN